MENKRESPVVLDKYEELFSVSGKVIFRVEVTTYKNKEYSRIAILFPDGSIESIFVSNKRWTEVKRA